MNSFSSFSMVSKASKAKNVVKKTVKSANKDGIADSPSSKTEHEFSNLDEKLENHVGVTRSRGSVDPWGNSIDTNKGTPPAAERSPTAMSDQSTHFVSHNAGIVARKSIGAPRAETRSAVNEANARPSRQNTNQSDSTKLEDPHTGSDLNTSPTTEDQPQSAKLGDDILTQRLVQAFEKEKQLTDKVKQLEQQCQQQKDRCAELDRAWKKSIEALTQIQKQQPLHKVDDQVIQGLYRSLVFDVANWAANFCRAEGPRAIDRRNIPMLESLSPNYQAYLQTQTLRTFLLQATLMRLLVTGVLTIHHMNGLWWSGRSVKALRKLQLKLIPAKSDLIPGLLARGDLKSSEIRAYTDWRSQTALYIASKVTTPEMTYAVEEIKSRMKADLYMFVYASDDNVWTELGEIVRKAIKLDEEMNKSRALWTVACWGDGNPSKMNFDRSIMETAIGAEAPRSATNVELVLAPALVKTGTADGDAFDKTSYLCKWTVLCAENRKKL